MVADTSESLPSSAGDLAASGGGADADDNGHGPEEPYQKSMEFLFEVVFMSVIGVLGIVGNATMILLFARRRRHDTQLKFHRLMMMLASFDTLYIVLSLLLFTAPQVTSAYKTSGAHFYILPRALPLAQISLTGSIYSTLAITVERYLTVCHPFFTVSHKWTARWYIVPIVAFSLVYNAPKFFELTTGVKETNVTMLDANNTEVVVSSYRYSIEPTDMRINEHYIKVYCIWMNFVFMGLIPFCLLLTLNFITLHSLVVHSKPASHGEFSMSKKNEIALAKVSLTIVLVFILCHSVKWIPNLFELYRLASEDKRAWPPWVESTTHISHFLMTFNCSVNFYIYCAKHYNVASSLFGLCRRVLCCCAAPVGAGSDVDTEDVSVAANGRNSLRTFSIRKDDADADDVANGRDRRRSAIPLLKKKSSLSKKERMTSIVSL